MARAPGVKMGGMNLIQRHRLLDVAELKITSTIRILSFKIMFFY